MIILLEFVKQAGTSISAGPQTCGRLSGRFSIAQRTVTWEIGGLIFN
jgi:hypothetical protein